MPVARLLRRVDVAMHDLSMSWLAWIMDHTEVVDPEERFRHPAIQQLACAPGHRMLRIAEAVLPMRKHELEIVPLVRHMQDDVFFAIAADRPLKGWLLHLYYWRHFLRALGLGGALRTIGGKLRK
jgi:hypothetical protein